MNTHTKLLITSCIAGVFLITGCGSESNPQSPSAHSENDGHDHSGHEDHHHDHGAHDDHGSNNNLGSITIAGSSFTVSYSGQVRANESLQLEIQHTAGPIPSTIRTWIGKESSVGSIKSKANGSDGHYHADTELPAEYTTEDLLWIEIETPDGQRIADSITLN